MKLLLIAQLLFYSVLWAEESIEQNDYNHNEAISGFYVDHQSMTFIVMSHGCTSKDDFELEIAQSYPVQIKLVRLNPDVCKAIPSDMTISFNLTDVGISVGEEFYISNEFVALHDY